MVHPVAAALPVQLVLQILGSGYSEQHANATVVMGTLSPEQSSATVHVPDGYTVFPEIGSAYKYFSHNLTWDSARKHCIAEGGNLAVIDSMKKVEYAKEVLRDYPTSPFLGIHRYFSLFSWSSVKTGLPTYLIPWRTPPAERLRYFAPKCSSLHPDGTGVEVTPCDSAGPHICEVSLTADEPFRKFDITEVPSGYTVYPHLGVAYKLFKTEKTWVEAHEYCFAQGGTLPIPDSWEKVEIITDMKPADRYTHVGLHREFNHSEWIDVKSGLPPKMIPWRRIASKNDQDSNCAAETVADGDHGLYGRICYADEWFICELSLSEDSSKPSEKNPLISSLNAE